MTRQKKEIVKRINQICAWIEADQELGCGFAAARAYDGMYREIDRLEDELARLQHYASVEDMLYDTRGCENSGCPW